MTELATQTYYYICMPASIQLDEDKMEIGVSTCVAMNEFVDCKLSV